MDGAPPLFICKTCGAEHPAVREEAAETPDSEALERLRATWMRTDVLDKGTDEGAKKRSEQAVRASVAYFSTFRSARWVMPPTIETIRVYKTAVLRCVECPGGRPVVTAGPVVDPRDAEIEELRARLRASHDAAFRTRDALHGLLAAQREQAQKADQAAECLQAYILLGKLVDVFALTWPI